jgi:hypothetical protein
MTPTAYIVTLISEPPKEDGWYSLVQADGKISPLNGVYQKGKWSASGTHNVTHWLKPVDLSKMLEETFKRGWYDRGYDRKSLKQYMDEHIFSILNPTK